MKRSWPRILALFSLAAVMLLLALAAWIDRSGLSRLHPPPCDVDCTQVAPGTGVAFLVASTPMTISVPAKESATGGSYHVKVLSMGYDSGPLERNGSLESVWIADVSGDGTNDVIVVTRCGGTGLFTSLTVFERHKHKYRARPLPQLSPPASVGYCGKEIIWVKDGGIHAAFPTYESRARLRVNHQWGFDQVQYWEMPLKIEPDANAFPSGPTGFCRFDYRHFRWQVVTKLHSFDEDIFPCR